MKYIFVLSIVLAISSCTSSRDMVGTYVRLDESIELKSDGTFYYIHRYGRVLALIRGTWAYADGGVLIRNLYDIDNIPIDVEASYSERSGVTFLFEPHGEQIGQFMHNIEFGIIVNNRHIYRTNSRSIHVSLEETVESFKVIVYHVFHELPVFSSSRDSLSTATFYVDDNVSNLFVVSFSLEPEMFLSNSFVSDTLTVRGRNLVWDSKGPPPFRRMVKN